MIFGFVMLLLGKQLYAIVQISNFHLASWPSRTNLMHICCLNPSGYLHGVEVIDDSILYNGKAQSFEWSKFGFKLHFLENVLCLK